jgi:hypothetical protein
MSATPDNEFVLWRQQHPVAANKVENKQKRSESNQAEEEEIPNQWCNQDEQ